MSAPTADRIGAATVAEIREMLGGLAGGSDRDLLVRVNRWRRANGWHPRGYNNWWDSADHLTSVWWEDDLVTVTRERRRHESFPFSVTMPVASVREAVDFLALAGVLPVEFSSMFAAGRADRAAGGER